MFDELTPMLRGSQGCCLLVVLMIIASMVARAEAQGNITAHVDQAMQAATFVNIYWDANWDAHNPNLGRRKVDAVTRSLIGSTYFGGLTEYGVDPTQLSFAGSFLPNKACPQVAPQNVGFYDPIQTSIAGFVQCEHDNELALQGANMIYNVILPTQSIESDFFTQNFCNGAGSPNAWHYHGLEKISIFPFNTPFADGPVYTIDQTNPRCLANGDPADFFATLTHEMVEALTDPYPVDISIIPPHAQFATENEIGDICEPGAKVPGSGSIPLFKDASGASPTQNVSVTTYWSNAKQTCLSFTDVTIPNFAPAGVSVANFGPNMFLEIKGSGFGTFHGGTFPLIVNDNTDFWQGGSDVDENAIIIPNVVWSPNLLLGVGLTGLSGFHATQANANLTVGICNQNSLRCASNNVTTPALTGVQTFAIQTAAKNFLTAVNGGGIGAATDPGNKLPVHTDAKTVGIDEQFSLAAANGGGIAITSAKKPPASIFGIHYLTAVNGGGIGEKSDPNGSWAIHTDATAANAWEKFQLIANANGSVSFQTPDGHFLTMVNGGGIGGTDPTNQWPIHTNAATSGSWENFALIPQ